MNQTQQHSFKENDDDIYKDNTLLKIVCHLRIQSVQMVLK